MYDYIVIGAGSAGSVVAARLSEDPSTRVLVRVTNLTTGAGTVVLGPRDHAGRPRRRQGSVTHGVARGLVSLLAAG